MKGQKEIGLLQISVKKVISLYQDSNGKFSTFSLVLSVVEPEEKKETKQIVIKGNLMNESANLQEINMFCCSSQSKLKMIFNEMKLNIKGEMIFPLSKLIEIPRVRHQIEAIIPEQTSLKLNKKITNLVQVDLDILYFNAVKGKLIINLIDLELTRDTQLMGQMDPYIVLSFGDKEEKTKVRYEGGFKNIWTDMFWFQIKQLKNDFSITVYDKDNVKDDLVCSTKINLLNENMLKPTSQYRTFTFNLQYQGKSAGVIKIDSIFELAPFNY